MASGNKIVIALLSVSTENSTDQLIEQIKREHDDFSCVFVKLTQQDLQSFQPGEKYDAVVLLHSISQGRNSITDVADAKYSKLLPTLKRTYGPDRVAVVVHSMTSFNSNTKMALMMVFKKSQPTTFQCSKCVIQCNNLAEMRAEDLSRLTEFLGKVRDHPLPIADKEAHSTLITTPSADKINRIGTGGKPQNTPVSGSVTKGDESMTSSALSSTDTSSISQTEVGRSTNASAISIDSGSSVDPLGVGPCSEVAPTQPTNNQTLMTSVTPSTGMEDDNIQNIASVTSQVGASSSDTAQMLQASSKVDTSPDKYATPDKVIDTTYPIALFSLSTSNQPVHLLDGLQRQLPGKTIMSIKDIRDLASNWHLFETILVDLGSLQQAASHSSYEFNKCALDFYQKCKKEMLVPQNMALLMRAPTNAPADHKHADTIRQFPKMNEVPVFQYSSESCRPPLFDDITKNRLFSWLLDSCIRYHTAANKKGSGFLKKVKDFMTPSWPSWS
ncbi:uncharacterized protein LOC115920784 [Strongylocentrotus purpuratus]|uniref:Uncharacterized protein n=1 Tax=Strongylocentrotus purpuratus TaxID=7668 RepID=A0A7M7NCZ0_STRPU|nr:uncharacterized protein LOC115920784 [Strongylocentrotus purpuratus]